MKKDITEKVEKLEALEEKLGIKIDGLYCEWELEDNEYSISLTAEVFAESGNIDSDIEFKMAVYDEKNRVIGDSSIYLFEETFAGFDTISIYLSGLIQTPTKIRLFPKKN